MSVETSYPTRALANVLGDDGSLVGRAATTGTGNVVLSASPTLSGTIVGSVSFAGPVGVANSSPATSPTTGGLTVVGGLGVGGQIYAAGTIETDVLSSTAPTVFANQGGGYTATIANGASAPITASNVGGYFLIFVSEASSSGDMALYMVANAGGIALLVFNNGNWVSSTTTPASGKFSIAWNGTTFSIYNNQGSTLSFKTFVFGM